jgi:hypothetical protein
MSYDGFTAENMRNKRLRREPLILCENSAILMFSAVKTHNS